MEKNQIYGFVTAGRNVHKHRHTPRASIFCSSSRYQTWAWHRAAACVSRSFISYTRYGELKANCTAGYVVSLSNPLLWAAHDIRPLQVKLNLPPVVVSPGDRFTERDMLFSSHGCGGYRNILHNISHRFHNTLCTLINSDIHIVFIIGLWE